jgi:Uma2 family endonuclease
VAARTLSLWRSRPSQDRDVRRRSRRASARWRVERLPVITDDEPYFTLAPDWVCEVLSPSTAKLDRAEKLPLYAAARLSHVWLVGPLLQTLEVLELDGSTWRILGVFRDDARVRARPFDAIELELAALWDRVLLR